jgi:hypothetical protein
MLGTCVAGLSLETVREVEHQARTLAVHHPGHELLELVDQVLVALEGDHLVPPRLESVDEAIDGLHPDLLAVRHAEQVDHFLRVAVVDDGHLHR